MDIRTYPLQAVALDADGTPWYPFRSPETDTVLYVREPHLPNTTAVWATVPEEFADRPHIDLDAEHLGQILYCTRHSWSGQLDLNGLTVEQLEEILASGLTCCGCDPRRLADLVYGEVGMEFDGGGYTMVSQELPNCLAAAARLSAVAS